MELQLLLISFLLSTLVYFLCRRSSHRNLPPSPQLWLPIVGHMHLLGPLLHRSLHTLSLRYGPLCSFHLGSLPCVVASTPHYAKLLLQTNELSFNTRLETSAVKRILYGGTSMAFSPYGDYWRFVKKLTMNKLLGSRSVESFQHLRAQEFHMFLRHLALKAKACEAVNVTEELLKLTNDVISRMILGEAEEAREVVRDVTRIFGEFDVADCIWLFKKLERFRGTGKRIEDIFQRFDSLAERIICKREEERKTKRMSANGESEKVEGEVRDFLDVLLDCMEDENSEIKVNRIHIKALIVDLFTAGTDTTAISTEWALVELMKHPMLLQKARDEIDIVVGKNRLVEESDCPNLPYLQAIVKETLRLHPPVPLVTRKCVEDCKIENYVIPKNSLLFVNVWTIGRDPTYWDNPLEFYPERFLELSKGDSTRLLDVRGQNFQLLPFGSGRRMCPGVTLVMQEVPALLGAIIQCFDFQMVDPKGKVLKGDDVVIDMKEKPGLAMPRAQNLVCVPVERSNCGPLKVLCP